ncbi:hypothetical protein CROQUDRAFT_667340 [Cronartium quercuum f. sp. fusiforme G11]|uniref:Uncharacterized protein n=1 Tax=Cronartium quercuum f. sp. fusiforme G11 TaxID=708437 RepID=A0A9P6NS96_9BASI|nr:hypothetical protein CROQUDRAFT_667340 [Cronartium quercuum f. sp. fusiforme G11]
MAKPDLKVSHNVPQSNFPLPKQPQIYHQLYQGIVICGIVFTTILLISMTLGKRKNKRHPIVIFFLVMAVLSYWNAILPWLIDVWNGKMYRPEIGGGAKVSQDSIQYVVCHINTILGSFFRAVMPSFAATFVGEALRIVLNIWRFTNPEVSGQTKSDELTLTIIPKLNDDQKESITVIHPESPDPTHMSPKMVRWDTYQTYDTEDNLPSRFEYTYPQILSSSVSRPQSVSYDMNQISNYLGPVTLCLIPLICGLPPLITTIIATSGPHQALIYADMVKCSALSNLVDSCTVVVLMFVLAFTVILSALTLSSFYILPGPTSILKTRNLDKTFLIRITMLSIISALGCLIIAVVKISSHQTYSWTLDLYFVLQPLLASATLVDVDCFLVWVRWLKILTLLNFLAPSVGKKWLRNLSEDLEPTNKTWTPPRPSYSRAHRPTSASTAGSIDLSDLEPIESSSRTRRISDMFTHGFGGLYQSFNRKRPGTANRVSWWTFPTRPNALPTDPPSAAILARTRAKSVGCDLGTSTEITFDTRPGRRKSDWTVKRPSEIERSRGRTRKISEMLSNGFGGVYHSFSRGSPELPRHVSLRSFTREGDLTGTSPLITRHQSQSVKCESGFQVSYSIPPTEISEPQQQRSQKISNMISNGFKIGRANRPFSRASTIVPTSESSHSTPFNTSNKTPQQETVDSLDSRVRSISQGHIKLSNSVGPEQTEKPLIRPQTTQSYLNRK